jgi:hypothetical protein
VLIKSYVYLCKGYMVFKIISIISVLNRHNTMFMDQGSVGLGVMANNQQITR